MGRGLRWLLSATTVICVFAATPVLFVRQIAQASPLQDGVHLVAAYDDDGDDDGDDDEDERDNDDDDDSDDDSDDDGDDDDVRWRVREPDGHAQVTRRGARTSRRGERPKKRKATNADIDRLSSFDSGSDAGSVDHDDQGAGPAETFVRRPDSDVTSTQRRDGLLALAAISGTAVVLGAAYWLMGKLHPSGTGSKHARPGPTTGGMAVMAGRDRQSGAGWRWRRCPEGRCPEEHK